MLSEHKYGCFKETRLLIKSQNTKVSGWVFCDYFGPLLSVQFAGGRPESHCNVTQFALQPHPQDRGPDVGLAPAPLGPLLQQHFPDWGCNFSDFIEDFKFILQPNN